MSKLLEVKNLKVNFSTYGGEVKAVRDVSFHINESEILAIVGESGSGKSVTVQTIMGLLPKKVSKIKSGTIHYKGQDLLKLKKSELRKLKGSKISMVFQDPMTSLNPTMRIGSQIAEGLIIHHNVSKREAKIQALEMIKMVGIPNPEQRYNQYPHEFSGGMRQRVMIAIALACKPELLIADEPTTALDVTIQAQVLNLMIDLKDKMNTQDLGVVAETAERVAVMYAGVIVETGTVNQIFKEPKHPYTWGLMESIPDIYSDQKERLIPIEGSPPDLFAPPEGCPFVMRCKYAMEICESKMPGDYEISPNHTAKCWLNDEKSPSAEEVIALGGAMYE